MDTHTHTHTPVCTVVIKQHQLIAKETLKGSRYLSHSPGLYTEWQAAIIQTLSFHTHVWLPGPLGLRICHRAPDGDDDTVCTQMTERFQHCSLQR